MYLSIVVPCFNEEANINELHNRIFNTLKNCDLDSYEIIYINDGSTDNSQDILNKISNKYKNVKTIKFLRNFGQHAAVMAGLKHSIGDFVITLDADLQNPPEEIPKFLEKIEDGYDIVAGKRLKRKDSLFRKIPSLIINKLIAKLTESDFTDYGCMMRAYKRNIIENLLKYGEKSVYIPAFIGWLGGKSIEIGISHDKRASGSTKYSFLSLMRQVFDLITAYTLVPIQLISVLGFIFLCIGFSIFIFLMIYRFFIGTNSGLTSFVAISFIFSGITIFSLGVISEYLSRLYKEQRKFPFYIIENITDSNNIDKESL